MKSKFTSIYSIFAFLCIAFLWLSFKSGQANNYAGHPNDIGTCANCHGSIPGDGSVVIGNLPSLIGPGQTYNLTLTINEPNPTSIAVGGFQILAAESTTSNTNIGTFTTVGGESRLASSGRLIQSVIKSINANTVSWDATWTAPASSNLPSEVMFYAVGNSANGNGGSGGNIEGRPDYVYSIVTDPIPTGTLAVEWLNFFVQASPNGQMEINWSTASEIDSDYFIVERSEDGKNFEEIARQIAQNEGNQVAQYTYQDIVKTKMLYYYRIREISLNGESQLSIIRSAQSNLTVVSSLSVYPNPIANGEVLTINLEQIPTTDIVLELFNLNGQLLAQQNIKTGSNVLNWKLPELVIGAYFVKIKNNNQIMQQKIVITE